MLSSACGLTGSHGLTESDTGSHTQSVTIFLSLLMELCNHDVMRKGVNITCIAHTDYLQ